MCDDLRCASGLPGGHAGGVAVMSQQPSAQESQTPSREDELLGVIADVEKQLSTLKTVRTEREELRQRLEQRETALAKREQEITELSSKIEREKHSLEERRQQVETSERETREGRAQIERDAHELAAERERTVQERGKVV